MLIKNLKGLIREISLNLGIYYDIYEFGKSKEKEKQDIEQKKFYSSIIKQDDIVFDVGANIGQRSNLFRKIARKVVAIEPQKECVRHLASRFNRIKNVEILHLALDEAEGEATIFECDSHVTSSMSKKFIEVAKNTWFSNNNWNKEVKVKTKTLDQIISVYGKPKFIKIDVEGYEKNVLKGLSKPIPYISFEYTTIMSDEILSCIKVLNNISSNYRYNYCVGEDLNFKLENPVSSDVFIEKILPLIISNPSFGDIYAIYSE